MAYKRIKPKKIYEEVAEALLLMIKEGELQPGDKIASVEQLAENFQVGRSAVREALSALRAMDILDIRQGEGTYVKAFSPKGIAYPIQNAVLMNKTDILHLLEVRKIMEVGAAYTAAEKRTEEDLLKMRAALDEMSKYSNDIEKGEKADLRFHLIIAEATGNPLLSSLMNHVSDLMEETMKETRRICLYSEKTTVDKLNEEHEAIFQAILNQDPEQARLEMRGHLLNVEKVLSEHMLEMEKKQIELP
ncbi:GntR family transcriptional repressor for pyruvate dehydrogenase complex [Bacillus ectoiniformans]|uniref:FadR/GntR family transcriptional regulator n=1 Tax=Bacillus ectoiniformans TaxID=1494429 RepID=UPI00195E91D4|nr:FadR/GntR family transcriptional regulator [Bacillus ectoiniformans]MBM7648599.1 GntR family transcriptional repressor for pyruvate dehydrogenase complex [Bacillus ectoiniformans]